MRILLIDPPFFRFIKYYNRYFPISLSYLAGVLEKEGHDVLVYDADCNVNPARMDYTRLEEDYPEYLESVKNDDCAIWHEMRNKIRDFRPDVIGITVWTTFAASSFKVASLCKEYDDRIPVVMGGPHISIKYEEVIKICSHVDFLVRGEGEETIIELVNVLGDHHDSNRTDNFKNELSKIRGLSYRENTQAVHNPPREFIKDLDSIPYPARELLSNKNSYSSEDMGLLMTSRGCPYNCFYCATSIWKRKIRYRSIDNVINEIKLVIDRYNTQQFTFKDDSFTVNRQRVMEFCNRLKNENIDISWDCNTRVDLVDEELLRVMKSAGCNSIKVGVESGSDRILKKMNKGITLDQVRRAARLFKKVGLHWTGYFMIGIPGDTIDDANRTLEFMYEIDPDFASISVYEPFPGTPMFEEGIEKGLVKEDMTLEDFYTTLPNDYYKSDPHKQIVTEDNDDFIVLATSLKQEFHAHNRRFKRILRRARSRFKLYLCHPGLLWCDFVKYLSWR